MDHDDLDEDIERLKIVLQDEENDDGGESDGELRALENTEDDYYSNASRPSTSSDVTASSLPTTSICTDADDAALLRFDPNTITAESCLAMNRAYQEVLLDTLRQIEMSLFENRARQKQLDENMDERVRKTDRHTLKESSKDTKSLPYFRDKDGEVPTPNADVLLKEQMNEDKQHVKPKSGWTKPQRRRLIDAIKLDALEQIIRPLLNKQEVEMGKLSRCKNSDEVQECRLRIEHLQQDIKHKQETQSQELLQNVDSSKIDFMKIAVMVFDNRFDSSECESMWNNVLRPGINRDRWSKEEDNALKELVTKNELRNWKHVASELGTDRTPYQCLQHYQQNNIVYSNSEWTEEEDELLKEVVETCTYGSGRVQWQQVAYYVDRRSAYQCGARWGKINPGRRLGRWSKDEDTQLLNGIQSLGGGLDWTKVQELVPTRCSRQCRERFVNRMSESLIFKPWTYEEDKKLLILQREHGCNWAKLAPEFGSRSDNMILHRYKRLMNWQQQIESFNSHNRKVQKQMLHPAFTISKTGEILPKFGLVLRRGRGRGRPTGTKNKTKRAKQPTEIEKLKADIKDALSDDDDNDEEDVVEAKPELDDVTVKMEQLDEEEDEVTRTRAEKDREQTSLDIFLATYNIQAEDYHKQFMDQIQGDCVVPRPPPLKYSHLKKLPSLWKRRNRLTDVVQTQIEVYLNKLQEHGGDGSMDINLYEQISQYIQGDNDQEKRRMIMAAFGGKNPCNLSVRELLNISRCIKEHGKPPKDAKTYNVEPWEMDASNDDEEEKENSSEDDIEAISDYEEKPKRPRSQRQKTHDVNLSLDIKKHHEVLRQLKYFIQGKMDPMEFNKGRGRRKQFTMYPKNILLKYRGLDEERKLNRKSLVLLMKTLDVNGREAYFKAKRGKCRLSAKALLKSTEKAFLRRAKTRRQKTEIHEAAKIEANMNSEISEVTDYLLELRDELKITEDVKDDEDVTVEDVDEYEDENKEGGSSVEGTTDDRYGYNKSLPYIPPNQTNLRGMRTLLLEHRCLIDQAGLYFDSTGLKEQLYQLKKKGPNPLMGVLNAICKTESVARKQEKDKNTKSEISPRACLKQLEDVRKTKPYKQLMARFQSMFTWPALLATVQPPRGKPLPQSLQLIQVPKKVPATQAAPAVNETGDAIAENCDVTATTDDVIEEDLPEEEAVEKLVDKIMEEYEKERMKKKRYLPTKKMRNFSDKQKQAFVEKERTKVLKRLGLYEKMQKFKRERREQQQQEAQEALADTSVAECASSTTTSAKQSTNPDLTMTETSIDKNIGEMAAESARPLMITSEGCQTEADTNDVETKDITVTTEIVTKRKRGRPKGAKTARFSDASPERKSARTTDSPTLAKQEHGFQMSLPKKKNCSRRGTQYNLVRHLIPEKMSKIAAQIPELPILNEPIPEKLVKPAKPKKEPKPVAEKKRVAKSKFAIQEGKLTGQHVVKATRLPRKKTGPKTDRLFRQLQEATEAAAGDPRTSADTKVQIKSEPRDSMKSEDDDVSKDGNVKYKVTVAAGDEIQVLNSSHGKILTSRAKKMLDSSNEASKRTRSHKNDLSVGSENEECARMNVTEMYNLDKRKHTDCAVNGIGNLHQVSRDEPVSIQNGQSMIVSCVENLRSLEQSNGGTESQKTLEEAPGFIESQKTLEEALGGTESRKPLLIAVPVFIDGIQQIACVPFYPDKDGKITLPSGKKIDAISASDAGGSMLLPSLSDNKQLADT